MATKYQHTELPTKDLIEACADLKREGNSLALYVTIARNILQFPEGRETLQKRLGLRYLGNQLGMDFSNVRKSLKKLIKKGYIRILEIGKDKTASLIELIIKGVNDTTEAINTVVKSTVVDDTTKQKNNLYNKTNNNTVDVPFIKNNKKSSMNALEDPAPEASPSSTITIKNNFSENLPAPPSGVVPRVMREGIKDLQKRGIKDLVFAVKAIGQEMSKRIIKNGNGYFRKLCRDMDFSNSQTTTIQNNFTATPAGQAAVVLKAQEENDKKYPANEVREKSPLDQLKEYEKNHPKEIAEIKSTVRIHPNMNIPIVKAVMYIQEFNKKYKGLI